MMFPPPGMPLPPGMTLPANMPPMNLQGNEGLKRQSMDFSSEAPEKKMRSE
jgi:hypothetical protein